MNGSGMPFAELVYFLVGMIAASVWFHIQAGKARKKWNRERNSLKAQLAQLQAEAQKRPPVEKKLPQDWELPNHTQPEALQKNRERKTLPAQKPTLPPETLAAPAEAAAPAKPRETDEERIQRLCGGFRAVETLQVQFQYSFPDSLLLQSGRGYMRSVENLLLPEASTLLRVNSTKGYAMEGMFYLYDVIYRGRLFTYQQILDGMMGNSYVRIEQISEPAVIEQTGHYGYYRLVKKGKMEVSDIE